MTGLWQVSGRNRLTYRQRVELDVAYVDRWSLGPGSTRWAERTRRFTTGSIILMFKPTYPSGRPPWRLLNGLPRVSGRTEPSGRKPSDSR